MQVTKTALLGLVKHSPMFLFVSMSLSFLLMFLVQLFYYSALFQTTLPTAFAYIIAFSVGLMFQFSRLAFGVAGASEFADGNTGKGLFGMLFSLGLTIFESFEVSEIALIWNQGELYVSCLMILQSVVWLGFLLEIRLAINVAGIGNRIENRMEEKKSKNGAVSTVVKT